MSSEFTIGVEEEYQLVAPGTGELRSRARDVLDVDWSGDLVPENQQTMLEIGTRVCASADELEQELGRLRLQVTSAAAAEGLRGVAAGIHPFSRWEDQVRTRGERYQKILERYGRVIRTEHIFGMHTHVAVPDGLDRVAIMSQVRAFTPYLLALSASSPIYEGADTSYASYRTIVNQRLPNTGPPPHFASSAEMQRYLKLLLDSGAIEDEYNIYWSIRPHPEYPTLEFRATDVCPRVEDAVAIAALTRAIVAGAAQGLLEWPTQDWSESTVQATLAMNEWLAARFGLGATLLALDGRDAPVAVRDGIGQLVHQLRPVAESLGDGEALDGVGRILLRGNGADRIRDQRRCCQELPELVDWLAGETLVGVGLDRRAEQRGG